MKLGRYEESIENYEAALSKDAAFVASYVGIGNNYIFMRDFEQARSRFRKLHDVARNDGQRRLAYFWTAVSFLHEGDDDQAMAELEKRYEIAAATDDKQTCRSFGQRDGPIGGYGSRNPDVAWFITWS